MNNTDIINTIRELQIKGEIQIIAEKFAYNGFSAESVFLELKRKESNANTLVTELSTLLTIAMTRGTNLTNIMKRSKEDAREELQRLINKYSIKRNTKDGANNNTITLARLMSAFPHLCYDLAKMGFMRDPIGDNSICPMSLRFTSAPAIIKNEDLYNAWLDWAIQFDAVINPNNANPENVRLYGRISFGSPSFKGLHPELDLNVNDFLKSKNAGYRTRID